MPIDPLMFVQMAEEDFEREYGRKPSNAEDWADVQFRAQTMAAMRQAALETQPTNVAGWKFGQDEIEWSDA